MENTNYLNKALQEAAKTLKAIEPQRKVFEESIPTIKAELRKQGHDMTMISRMEEAAKNGDLNTIINLKSKLHK